MKVLRFLLLWTILLCGSLVGAVLVASSAGALFTWLVLPPTAYPGPLDGGAVILVMLLVAVLSLPFCMIGLLVMWGKLTEHSATRADR